MIPGQNKTKDYDKRRATVSSLPKTIGIACVMLLATLSRRFQEMRFPCQYVKMWHERQACRQPHG